MSFRGRGSETILIFAGLGIGVVCGALIGLIIGRKSTSAQFPVDAETVQELRARAEQVLSELSASVSSLENFDEAGEHETRNTLSALIGGRNGTEEAMG